MSQGWISVAIEFIQLLFICIFSIVISIYRLIVPAKEEDVSNEIVLITGTGHGIGRQIALKYSKLGATVIGLDINDDNNAETAKVIKKYGGKFQGFNCDVTDRTSVLKLAEKIKMNFGAVTILVNNAGILFARPICRQTEQEIRKTFDINILAHYWLIHSFLPDMIEQNHGHIVAICSITGLYGVKNLTSYCASKFAVRGTMEGLLDELQCSNPNNKIKTTIVYPYMVDTGFMKKPLIRFNKLMKLLTPEEVAAITVSAQRQGIENISIPSYWMYASAYVRLMPSKCFYLFNNFIGTGIDSYY